MNISRRVDMDKMLMVYGMGVVLIGMHYRMTVSQIKHGLLRVDMYEHITLKHMLLALQPYLARTGLSY